MLSCMKSFLNLSWLHKLYMMAWFQWSDYNPSNPATIADVKFARSWIAGARIVSVQGAER